jgi:hypothetical protein
VFTVYMGKGKGFNVGRESNQQKPAVFVDDGTQGISV